MSFDRLAPHYSWMEWLLAGRELQKCRTAFLTEASRARQVLLAGEGHGRFLLELCRINKHAAITYVDASAEMARVARQRVLRAGFSAERIQFHTQPILAFEAPRGFDLIVTNFFLDCFDAAELAEVVQKLAGMLEPGGHWILVDFQIPAHGWRALRARLVLALAYAFFRVTTHLTARRLVLPSPLMVQSGLQRESRQEFNFDLLYAEYWVKPKAI